MKQEVNTKTEKWTEFLPPTVNGWKARQPDGVYGFDTLFDLIDGGAEVYRSLNVQKVINRTYVKEDAASIIVDVFDMGSSRDAFGAFHHDVREETDVGIGQESEYQGGSLFFWKDRYFVSIITLEETTLTKEAVLALGNAIADAIVKSGRKPIIVKYLPEEGLLKDQIFYFHDANSLSNRYVVGEGNPLGLSQETEGLLARYRCSDNDAGGGSVCVLLVVDYPKPLAAKKALKIMLSTYLNNARPGTIIKRADNLFAGARIMGSTLLIVLEASSEKAATQLLQSAEKRGAK